MPEPDTVNDTVLYEDTNIHIASGASYNVNGIFKVNDIPIAPSSLADVPVDGEFSGPRYNVVLTGNATDSGQVQLTFFEAKKTEMISKCSMWCAATAAGATPSIVKACIYEEATNGNLTLVGVSPNITSAFNTIYTVNNFTLVTPFQKKSGKRYGAGFFIVTAAAIPTIYALNSQSASLIDTLLIAPPRLAGMRVGQSDVPASINSADVVLSRINPFVWLRT